MSVVTPDDPPEREARIRELAYSLWEAEGRPQGRAEEFWQRASAEIGAEEFGGADPIPDISEAKAAIEEKMGEIAGRLAEAAKPKRGVKAPAARAPAAKRAPARAKPKGDGAASP
jgi:hypothetical protein